MWTFLERPQLSNNVFDMPSRMRVNWFMYGKIFESMYKGSMIGSGSAMFAVWGYVIANMRSDVAVGAQVDLNPKYLAFVLGENPSVVEQTIEKLCAPDPDSTSKTEEGRRLIKIGQFAYRVVNGAKYMAIRNEEERREYFRSAKRRQRQKQPSKSSLARVRRDGEDRERRYTKADVNGDTAATDRIAAERTHPED